MNKTLFALFVLAASLSAQEKKGRNTQTSVQAPSEQKVYACPMDCEKGKTYDKPGSCPKCKMDLVEKKTKNAHEHANEHKH